MVGKTTIERGSETSLYSTVGWTDFDVFAEKSEILFVGQFKNCQLIKPENWDEKKDAKLLSVQRYRRGKGWMK